jgi:hypothetical protein
MKERVTGLGSGDLPQGFVEGAHALIMEPRRLWGMHASRAGPSGLLAIALVLLAGCSQDPGPDVAGGSAPGDDPTTREGSAPDNTTVVEPLAVALDLAWSGELAPGAWLCDGAATSSCLAQPDDAYGVEHRYTLVAGNTTSGNLTVTWTQETPATAELDVDAYVFVPGCADCDSVQVVRMAGTSPLTTQLPADTVLDEGAVLAVWVYSSMYQAQGPVAAGTSAPQAFDVTGDWTVLTQAG